MSRSPKIFVKLFGRELDVKTTKEYPMSSYIPRYMLSALKKSLQKNTGIRDTDYVLGPMYERNDFQFGLTGGVQYSESFLNAAIRESGEEIGLVPKHREFLKERISTFNQGKKVIVYDCHISNMTPVLDHQKGIKITSNSDDRNKKIGCLIYGSQYLIKKFLSNPVYLYSSEDKIKGVVAIKVSDMLKLIKLKIK